MTIDNTSVVEVSNASDSLQGVTVPENLQAQQTVVFANEIGPDEETGDRVKVPSNLSSMVSPVYSDLANYLGRPRRIDKGFIPDSWPSSASYNIDTSFLNDFLKGRAQGSYGLRFTSCFRLQIATTPYTAGLLRMSFQPFYDDVFNDYNVSRVRDRSEVLPQRIQLPGVNFDLNQDTQVELRIPYAHYLDFIVNPVNNLVSNFFCLGNLSIRPYLNPSFPSSNTVYGWSLYYWMEDVEFYGFSGVTNDADVVVAVDKGVWSQSGMAAEQNGLLSKTLYAGADALDVVSNVPGASHLKPLSWASRLAAKASAAFGFSKPTNLLPTTTVAVSTTKGQFHADSDNPVSTLATLADAKISYDTNCFGSTVDEMNMDYFLSKPGLLYRATINTTTGVSGTRLFTLPVCPATMYYSGGILQDKAIAPITPYSRRTQSNNEIYTTPPFLLSTMSNLWRGDFRVKVRMGKTKFHTGRVTLNYNPTATSAEDDGVSVVKAFNNDSGFFDSHTLIWDLREGNEIDFVLPYTSNHPYLTCANWAGTFSIQVLDTVVFPETVAQAFEYSVEISCEPGFRFAAFREPWAYVSPLEITSQSGMLDQPSCQVIGEEVTSVKQLLSKSDLASISTGFSDSHPWLGADLSRVLPLGMNRYGNTLAYDVSGQLTGFARTCLHDMIILCYSMMRGSTDFEGKCTTPAAGVAFSLGNNDVYGLDPATLTVDPALYTASRAQALSTTTAFGVNNLNEQVRINVPMYTGFRVCPIFPRENKRFITSPAINLHRFGTQQLLERYVFWRSAGDDFQLGNWIGTPAISLVAGAELQLPPVPEGPGLYDNFLSAHTGPFLT